MTITKCQQRRPLCIKIRQKTVEIISAARESRKSGRKLADMLQMAGLDIDKNAVQRIESGKRFVTDIELKVIAEVLGVSYENLLDK